MNIIIRERSRLLLLLSVEATTTPVAPLRAVILVAEDEVVVRNIVCVMLQREGHKVLAASNGREALEVARRFNGKIDLVISDIQMPEVDGLTMIDLIRAERSGLRFLLMSGKTTSPLPEDKIDIPFLRKPFRSAEFMEKVRETLGYAPESE